MGLFRNLEGKRNLHKTFQNSSLWKVRQVSSRLILRCIPASHAGSRGWNHLGATTPLVCFLKMVNVRYWPKSALKKINNRKALELARFVGVGLRWFSDLARSFNSDCQIPDKTKKPQQPRCRVVGL